MTDDFGRSSLRATWYRYLVGSTVHASSDGEWRMANGEWRMANGEWHYSQELAAFALIGNAMHGNGE